MADISAQSIPEFGNLMTAFPRNQANIENTQANTKLTGAQTGLVGAQTGLTQMQTQKAAFEVQMIRQAMESLKNLPNGQDEQSGETPAGDPSETGVASSLNKKMYVNPMGPPGIQQYINATAWVNPAEAARAEEMRKTLVAAQTSKNQNEANDIFQTASALSGSGAGLQTLLTTTHPGSYLNNVGKAIASMQDKSPEEKDAMARTAIQAAAKYSHQYTGRGTEVIGDEIRDKDTKFPVFAPKAGPTVGEQIDIGKWSNTPQTVTIDNRDTTVKPKDLGIKSYGDLTNNKSIKFSVPPPSGSSGGSAQAETPAQAPANASGAGPVKHMTPEQARNTPSSQGGPPIPGLSAEQSDFVKQQPSAFPQIKSNQKLNSDDQKQRDIYRKQAEDLAKNTNTEFSRAQDSVAQIKRINTLLATPGLTLGPGSHEYAQLRTVLENWTGTPSGQAGAYQILSKVLNASEMNDLLQQFHSEGAQVRLGAYESRLIMEKLAANPNLTKSAIQQMLQWQASDAKYTMEKSKVASHLLQAGKSVANFDTDYREKFPKQDLVDSTLSILHPKGMPDFSKVNGKSYSATEVSSAAAKLGIPLAILQDKLTSSGATIK